MLEIQLYIEGKEIELYRDESITLTQSIQDIRDIEKVFTEYSRTFNVPASKPNNKIFKHFYNYYIDGFDARTKKSAELHVNFKPFKKGKIKLEGVQLKNNEPETYKLTFFGESVKLKDLIGDADLGVLSQLNTLDFDYTDSNVQTFMTNGKDGTIGLEQIDDAIIFPLITHTHRLIYNPDDTTAGTYNIFQGSDSNKRGVYLNQLKPAIRVHAIIKAIETRYDIKFSTDFFNTTNEEYYNLYLWLHTNAGGIFAENEAQHPVGNFTNIRGDVDVIRFAGGGSTFTNTGYNPDNLQRKMKVSVNVGSGIDYNLIIKLDGQEFQRFDGLSGSTSNGVSLDNNEKPEPFDIDYGFYTFFIESGSAADFDVIVYVQQDAASWLSSEKSIVFEGSSTVGTNELFSITPNLPEMKIMDFIIGLWKMFNLTSYVNSDGTIVVQPLDEYYASSNNQWDVTQYVDKTESIVDSVIPYRQVNLGYEGTDTFLADNHAKTFNKEWGQLNFQESQNYDGTTYEIKLPFEHMKFERLSKTAFDGKSNVQYGWSVDAKQESFVGKPLLFYAVKSTQTIAAVPLSGSRVNIVNPYMPSNSLDNGNVYISNEKQSLNFHPEYEEFDGSPNTKTLFATYYKKYLADMFDVRKRITNISTFLPMTIAQKMTLADEIIVFDRFYNINKMTTNYETGKTELELVNILEERSFVHAATTVEVDITDDEITVDQTDITVDLDDVTSDGFDAPGDPEIPDDLKGNDPSPIGTEPCDVEVGFNGLLNNTSTCDTVTFKAGLYELGLLCDQRNVDEFGFLIASAESYLTASDDIDTLKADGNITVRSTVRDYANNGPQFTTGIKSATIKNLDDATTRYSRFYVRTNINPDFEFADYISPVNSITTDCTGVGTADTDKITADDTDTLSADTGDSTGDGVVDSVAENLFYARIAGIGSLGGYDAIPTTSDILSNGSYNIVNIGETQDGVGFLYHNGEGETPQVGDLVKWTLDKTYAGGNANTITDGTSKTYYAVAVADPDTIDSFGGRFSGTILHYIVIEHATGEVVSIVTEVANQYVRAVVLHPGSRVGVMPYFQGRKLPSDADIVELEYQTSQTNPNAIVDFPGAFQFVKVVRDSWRFGYAKITGTTFDTGTANAWMGATERFVGAYGLALWGIVNEDNVVIYQFVTDNARGLITSTLGPIDGY